MKPSLHMHLKQTLSLGPKLQQAIRLLQLSAYELEAEIKSALDSNPLLELEQQFDEEIWNASASSNNDFTPDFSNLMHTDPSLRDYLLWQLNLTPFSDRDHIIAITLIDSITDEGYLEVAIEDIWLGIKNNYPAEFSELEIPEVLTVLHRIQHFDPPGIGARDLPECMLLQLQATEIAEDLRQQCTILISNHLELLARKNYAALKQKLQLSDADLKNVVAQIKRLNPKPGLLITPSEVEYIIPDVIAEKTNNLWHVSLHPQLAQSLRVNPNYAELMRTANNEFATSALRKQYAEAQWLIESIKNRNLTMLKVAAYIVNYQSEFLEHGEAYMRPLTLQVIAQELSVSESTISRITTKKYLHTPRGTFELKFFFSSHVSDRHGENCSSTAVKAIIKELINQEKSDQTLSDQEIANIIAQRGINIARRTVAKYREALGIQPSNLRGT